MRVNSVKIEMDDPVSHIINRSGNNLSTLYELPTCPVCLDRMDASVTGLVTVPCSHTFHCMCLSKWGDSRYVLQFFSSQASTDINPDVLSVDTPRLLFLRRNRHHLECRICLLPIQQHWRIAQSVTLGLIYGSVLSVATSAVADRDEPMPRVIMSLRRIFTPWNLRLNASGITPVTITFIV